MTTATSPFGAEHRSAPTVFEPALAPVAESERLDPAARRGAALTGIGLAALALAASAALGLILLAALFATSPGELL